ncbi:sensor histidine kinase [Actinomadura atramentaria]|uniref:sensor histidine kinase n=1 Tax=Actinomadura atramentaria TaxID=1990 RepID=UPI00037ED8A4|nr:histidine kinase [Actinomadura atramentaria]
MARDPGREGRLLTLVLVAGLMSWGMWTYVAAVWDHLPRPVGTGAGPLVIALNVLTAGLLVGGMKASRTARGPRWLPGAPPADPRRERVAVGVLLGALVAGLALASVSEPGIVLALIALWTLAARLETIAAVGVSAAVLVAIAVIGELRSPGGLDVGVLTAVVGLLLGAVANRRQRAAEHAARRAEAETVALDERSRMAREIHDILAHSLSAQVVHLEAARLLLSRDGAADRAQALDQVERAGRLARSGLEETRRALAALRGDAPPLDEALAALAADFAAATGHACPVRVDGEPRDVAPPVALAVVRTAQEALTNVRKHAPGADVRVDLAYTPCEIRLAVADTGAAGPPLDLAGGGYGLVGMRERAELIGGTLEAGPDGKGFRVSLRVPA